MELSMRENKKRIQGTLETLNEGFIAIDENLRLGARPNSLTSIKTPIWCLKIRLGQVTLSFAILDQASNQAHVGYLF